MEWELVMAGSTAYALKRMTGGPMDAVSDALGRFVEYRLRNVGRITENAAKKLGDDLEQEGEVPPRVMMQIFEDGSWSDDDVVVEYLGGLLAASRTPDGKDDRGALWAPIVAGLSSSALRTHYAVYALLRELLLDSDRNLGDHASRTQSTLSIPLDEYAALLGTSSGNEAVDMARHALNALIPRGLLDINWSLGRRDATAEHKLEEWVLEVAPTIGGIELFNWAHGKRSSDPNMMLRPDVPFELATATLPLPQRASVRVPREA